MAQQPLPVPERADGSARQVHAGTNDARRPNQATWLLADSAATNDQSQSNPAAMTEHRARRADTMRFATPTGDNLDYQQRIPVPQLPS